MFNVDRWGSYTKQKYNIRNINRYDGKWCDMTPKQLRRAVHKARKNNDWSIGVPGLNRKSNG
jgi:hypothetical protein